jgi:PAS domain S-box-containing protein
MGFTRFTTQVGRAERVWLAAALALNACLAAADAAWGPLAAAFVVAPLALAIFARPAVVAAAGIVSVALALAAPLWEDAPAGAASAVRLILVTAGSVLAYVAASRRCRREAAERDLVSLASVAAVGRDLPTAALAFDETGTVTLFTPRAEQTLGYWAGDVIGRSVLDLVPPALRGEHRHALAELVAGGDSAALGRRIETEALRGDGAVIPIALTLTRVNGSGPAAFVAYVLDIADQRRADDAQRLLADTADLLASSLDYEATLRDVAALAVPRLADWCAIDLPGPHGHLEPVAVAHVDQEKTALGRELRRRYPADESDALTQVARFGGSFLQEEIADDDLVGFAREEEHLELLRQVGFHSLMVVPLMAGRRTIGAMTFVAAESGRHFDRADLALAEELGRRAGTALENARLYSERSTLAQTLVGALRPPAMPPMNGWEAAALYQPAGRTEEVGGDFYDVISVADGGWMLVIGDVIGKGPAAAARTSLARYSIRTAAQLTGSPAAALRHLNEDLHREGQGGLMSAACVLLREDDDSAVATVAAAGHPLPVLVADGDPCVVGRSSLMLGVASGASITEETVRIGRGDSLVLYTDGVPDAKGRDERYGFQRLLGALHGTDDSAETMLRRVIDSVEDFQHGAQRDDIAMLVVRREDGDEAGAARLHSARD